MDLKDFEFMLDFDINPNQPTRTKEVKTKEVKTKAKEVKTKDSVFCFAIEPDGAQVRIFAYTTEGEIYASAEFFDDEATAKKRQATLSAAFPWVVPTDFVKVEKTQNAGML